LETGQEVLKPISKENVLKWRNQEILTVSYISSDH
jgi:hypothetical protein